jgi:DNA-binding NtrC family response regulator
MMQRLRMQVKRLGPHFRTILVSGEAGTGKELVARALHESSEGADGPFVVCPAAALDDDVERQLEKLMKRARRGTLFLEAIEEMSLRAQDRLLWVMQQKMYTRLIASCRQDLRIRAASGRFRGGLYHRLSMVEISIDRLRERTEDIPALATYFLDRSSRLYKKRVTTIAQDAMKQLTEYAWPGNVRELEDAVRRGVLESEGSVLDVKHLISIVDNGRPTVKSGTSHPMRLQDVVERHVLHVLKICAGNKLRAADLLGISRSTLYRMLDSGNYS